MYHFELRVHANTTGPISSTRGWNLCKYIVATKEIID